MAQLCLAVAHALVTASRSGATRDERVWFAYLCAATALCAVASAATAVRAIVLPCATALITAGILAVGLSAYYIYAVFGFTRVSWGWLSAQLTLATLQ